MNEIEDTMDELVESIAGLCLFYGIKTDKGGGKIVIDLLHKLEKQIKELLECQK